MFAAFVSNRQSPVVHAKQMQGRCTPIMNRHAILHCTVAVLVRRAIARVFAYTPMASRHHSTRHFTEQVREAMLVALVSKRQSLVVHSKMMQDRCMPVMNHHAVTSDFHAAW